MAIKELQTRIALKYDSYENWNKWYLVSNDSVALTTAPNFTDAAFDISLYANKGAALKLLPGEIALCYIETKDTSGKPTTAPTVLFKVGDGTKRFYELNWASAKAADVYNWAKAETVELFVEKDDEDIETGVRTLRFKTGSTVIKEIDLSDFVTNAELAPVQADIAQIKTSLGGTGTIGQDITTIKQRLDAIEGTDGAIATAKQEAITAAATAADGKVATGVATAKDYTDEKVAVNKGLIDTVTDTANDTAARLAAEIQRSTGIDTNLTGRVETLEAFFIGADADGKDTESGKTLYDALDTLKEIQDFINGEASAADQLVETVGDHAEAIAALEAVVKDGGTLESRVDETEADIAALDQRVTQAEQDIDTLESTVFNGADANTKLRTDIGELQEIAKTGNDRNAKLRSDLTALSNTVTHASTGLAATKVIADSAAETATSNASKIAAIESKYVSFQKQNSDSDKFSLFAGSDIIIFDCGNSVETINA
jgi:predicted  nucleic acid-binding Zn-ribbon protein